MTARLLPGRRQSVQEAGEIITRGGVVAVPTDTVYGLACDPRNGVAVARLFEIKGRAGKAVPVLCANTGTAARLVDLNASAQSIARLFWPGALTIVAPLKEPLPELLHQGSGWLGVRVPDNRVCLGVAKAAGGGITGTSANLSGMPSCRSAEEVLERLGKEVDAVIDGGVAAGRESTVVKIVGENVEVLRRGAVSIEPGAWRRARA